MTSRRVPDVVSPSDNACAAKSRDNYIACFYSDGSTYPGEPSKAGPGKIPGGFAPSTFRVLASYERLFGPIGLDLRLGFAFNGIGAGSISHPPGPARHRPESRQQLASGERFRQIVVRAEL